MEPEVSYSHPQTHNNVTGGPYSLLLSTESKGFQRWMSDTQQQSPGLYVHILKSQWGLTQRQLTGTLQSAGVILGKLQAQPAVEFCDRCTPGTPKPPQDTPKSQ